MLLLSLTALTTIHITHWYCRLTQTLTATHRQLTSTLSYISLYFTTKLTTTFNVKVTFPSYGMSHVMSLFKRSQRDTRIYDTHLILTWYIPPCRTFQLCVRDHKDFLAFTLIKADDILAWKQLSTHTLFSNCLKNLLKWGSRVKIMSSRYTCTEEDHKIKRAMWDTLFWQKYDRCNIFFHVFFIIHYNNVYYYFNLY